MHILAELLGRSGVEGEDAQKLAQELLATAEKEAEASADDAAADGDGGDGDGEDGDPRLHRRPRKPTGRKTARKEVIHKVTVERLPEGVQRLGLDAFERIGEDRMTTVERRVAALFEVTVIRPKFRAKTDAAVEAVKLSRTEHEVVTQQQSLRSAARLISAKHVKQCSGALGFSRSVDRVEDHGGLREEIINRHGFMTSGCAHGRECRLFPE